MNPHMNPRLLAYQLARAHRLGRDGTTRLLTLAGIGVEPATAGLWFWRVVAVLGAALGGLGLILWLAANWDTLGRAGRFALLQGFVVAMLLGAGARPALRAPLGLLALLGIGGLFAYFGQTYQTGADPWQLFALWAVLGLPLCLAVRSDVLWAPWALVVATGISLWMQAHTGNAWRVQPEDLPAHLLSFAASAGLVLLLGPLPRQHTGAGIWAYRTAGTLFVCMVTFTALGGLFARNTAGHYVLGLVLLAVAAAWLASRRGFEIFILSAVALGLNALVLCGLGRVLFGSASHDVIPLLLLMGLVSAGLLAASVNGILRLARRHAQADGVVA